MGQATCGPLKCSVVYVSAAVDDRVMGVVSREVIGSWFDVILLLGSDDCSNKCTMGEVTRDPSSGVTCVDGGRVRYV